MNKISHVTNRWVSKWIKINQSPLSFIQIPRFMPSLASKCILNKANLRDLIAAPGLIILVKLDSNRRFFTPCDLEIWWMTPHNNGAPLLYYIKLCASFQIHQWIHTGVTVQKHSVRVKIDDFLSHVTLKFDGWPWKTIGHLFNDTASFLHHFITIDEFKLELQSESAQLK